MDPEFLDLRVQGVSDLQACYNHALSGLIKAGTDFDRVGTELDRVQIAFYKRSWREEEQTWFCLLKAGVKPDGLLGHLRKDSELANPLPMRMDHQASPYLKKMMA